MKKLLLILLLFSFFAVPVGAETTLRLALLPIPDALPVHVAQELGLFAREGLQVEVLSVGSAVSRDQLMQAQRIDGMVNEISGAAALNRSQITAKIVGVARSPLGQSPLFRILAAPDSGVNTAADLVGISIGVSRNTVIEYISDRMLGEAGVKVQDIRYASVPVLPDRLQLLLSGQLQAATMPDPLGFSAMESGAVEIVNDVGNPLSLSVITFSDTAIREKKAAVAGFVRAWNEAAEAINADPERWRPLFLKKARVPKKVAQSYPIPPFPVGKLPTEVQWNDVMQWMLDKGLLNRVLPYESSVTAEFQTAVVK